MTNMFSKVKVLCALLMMGFGVTAYSAAPTVTSVTAQQRYPWNGLVDITVTLNGEQNDVTMAKCTFAASDGATKTALAIAHVTQQGSDTGSGTTWTRRFIWDTNADLGEVKIADVELVANVEDDGSGGVQLWDGGPYWATCNVGASKPEEYGLYFMWGDTEGHTSAGRSDLFECLTYGKDIYELQSLGYTDSTGNLTAGHDAATTYLGGAWRMPTVSEIQCLIDNCDRKWDDKRKGWIVKGKEGSEHALNSIFLPAAGRLDELGLDYDDSHGWYWTSTPGDSFGACAIIFVSGELSRYDHITRWLCIPVRPVRDLGSGSVIPTVTTHFVLDNRTGTRDANATERIRFSPAWETEGAMAVVSVNGVAVKNATVPGTFDWTPTQGGTYMFTHVVFVNGVQVGETLAAAFVVPEFGFEYFEQTGHAYVKSYSGTAECIEIPSVVYVDANGWQAADEASAAKVYQVTGISNGVFARNKTMKSVVFPASIQTIHSEAFYGCESLEQVTIPETVTSIGESAFAWCPKLKRAEVLGALELSANCFAYDSALETVIIGDKVTSLQRGYNNDDDDSRGSPFRGCEKLREVSVGSGITYILPYVFSGLKSLETIRFGAVIRDVYHHAFSGCESLKTIAGTLRPSLVGDEAFSGVSAYFGAQFDDCTSIGTAAFWNCRGFGGSGETHTLDLPKITSIGDGAFEGCVNMSAVQLGAKLKTIGANAFKDSGAQVVCFNGPPPSVGEGAFALPGEPQGVLRNWDSWQDWQSVIDINTGMWHGLHFSQVGNSATRAAYTFQAINDTSGTFDPKKVTAIVNMRISGEGGTMTYLEIDRCQMDPIGVCYVSTCIGGDYDVRFVYNDKTWKCTIDYDRFSAPLERGREMTVYFRRDDPRLTLNVYLYADEKAMEPYAKLSIGSGTDIDVLPMPPCPTPTWLYEFKCWRRRHYNVQSGKWEIGDPIPASECLGQDETDYSQGVDMHLVATWKWNLGGDDDFKAWKEMQAEEYDKVVVKSAKINDGETSELSFTVEDDGVFSFLWKTFTESGRKFALVSVLRNFSSVEVPTWDHAEFLVDGEVVAMRDGESQWEKVTVNLSGGSPHTVTWRYVKDDSGSAGEDCVWVSDIQFAAISDEETSDELLDESEYNWFYEDVPVQVTKETPFEYNPSVTPEEATCQVDIQSDIDMVSRSVLQDVILEGVQAGICRVAEAVGLEYAVVTSDGWEMVGNANLSDEEENVKASFVVDYSTTPSTIKYMISGHTLTNAEGASTFVCAAQKSHVESLSAKGSSEIHSWAGKYDVVNADVQQVAPGTETELAAGLDTFQNETFQVSGGGTLVIPGDKIPAGGVNRRLHVDGNSAVKFDLSGLSPIPSVTKLFNGVGNSFSIGNNIQLVVPGEGVDRVSKLFVKDGNLEARVAERPTISADGPSDSAFVVNANGDSSAVSASIGNAVEGFWYGLLATEMLTTDFLLDPDSVKQCTETGPLRLESSANANGASGFYRVSVSADKP